MNARQQFFELLDIAETHESELRAAQATFRERQPGAAEQQDRMTVKEREQLIIDLLAFLDIVGANDKWDDKHFILISLIQFIQGKKTAFVQLNAQTETRKEV